MGLEMKVGVDIHFSTNKDRRNECNYRIREDRLVPDLGFEIPHWKRHVQKGMAHAQKFCDGIAPRPVRRNLIGYNPGGHCRCHWRDSDS